MTKQERLEKQRQRLEEMKKPEAELHENGYRYIAGVDEVGRGPLAGPVVAAAVVMQKTFREEKRRDVRRDKAARRVYRYRNGRA